MSTVIIRMDRIGLALESHDLASLRRWHMPHINLASRLSSVALAGGSIRTTALDHTRLMHKSGLLVHVRWRWVRAHWRRWSSRELHASSIWLHLSSWLRHRRSTLHRMHPHAVWAERRHALHVGRNGLAGHDTRRCSWWHARSELRWYRLKAWTLSWRETRCHRRLTLLIAHLSHLSRRLLPLSSTTLFIARRHRHQAGTILRACLVGGQWRRRRATGLSVPTRYLIIT